MRENSENDNEANLQRYLPKACSTTTKTHQIFFQYEFILQKLPGLLWNVRREIMMIDVENAQSKK